MMKMIFGFLSATLHVSLRADRVKRFQSWVDATVGAGPRAFMFNPQAVASAVSQRRSNRDESWKHTSRVAGWRGSPLRAGLCHDACAHRPRSECTLLAIPNLCPESG